MMLTEPKQIQIDRLAGKQKSKIVFTNEDSEVDKVRVKRKFPRPAGDGMEMPSTNAIIDLQHSSPTFENELSGSMSPIPLQLSMYRSMHSMPNASKLASSYQSYGSDVSSATDVSQVSYLQSEVRSLCDASDSLQSKMALLEEHNRRLIEEKLKLSSHLGVQTQVNLELKRLLVASLGEDLQERFEKLTIDKAQLNTQLQHVTSQLEGDMEEIERLHIQCDLWRSKFLASRVMVDELSSWKSALYFKYKESQTALQKLLEEHYQFRAIATAMNRQLIEVTESLECKDASLDWGNTQQSTTLDLNFLNHDLLQGIVEVLQPIQADPSDRRRQRRESTERNDEMTLSDGEQLAQKTLLNSDVESQELRRLRQDYLAHSRTSHLLSTNYHAMYNCCENCSGAVQIV